MSAPTIDIFVDLTISVSDALADATSFDTPIGIFDHSATANRVDGPYSTIEEVEADGFTTGAEPEVHGWAQSVLSQRNNGGVDQLKIGRQDAGDATWTVTMTAVDAEDDGWYFGNIESRVEADILLVAAYMEARTRPGIFIAQSSDAALLAGTAGNVGLDLQTQGYHRTALIYHAIDDSTSGSDETDGFLDGAWTGRCGGFNLDGPNGVGRWSYKELAGVPYDTFTSAQVSAIQTADANFYGLVKGLSFPFPGTMASGRFIDVTTSVDWIKARLEEEIITTFVNDPVGLGFDAAGIGKLDRAGKTVIGKGKTYGHLSLDQGRESNIPWPSPVEVSSSERTLREVNVPAATFYLKGGINKVIMNLTVVP